MDHDRMRLDKWLWAARFYKTRSLASQEVGKGRILVNGDTVKPARDIRPGDLVEVRREQTVMVVCIRALSQVRGPAPVAQGLYEETAESLAARELAAEQRRLAPEPALEMAKGRPTKRERRDLEALRRG